MAEHEHSYELVSALCAHGNALATQAEIEHLTAGCSVKSVMAKCGCGRVVVQQGGGPVEQPKKREGD